MMASARSRAQRGQRLASARALVRSASSDPPRPSSVTTGPQGSVVGSFARAFCRSRRAVTAERGARLPACELHEVLLLAAGAQPLVGEAVTHQMDVHALKPCLACAAPNHDV